MMTDLNTRIKKLSPLLINQLAAGEVVTRPAAVVKELLENAIDAGATHIEIHITQGGMGMIEVTDNGVGIHPDDMVMAITRHATSKVADVANLHGITTLGFRGEALAATAAVSRLTLKSSHDDTGVGWQLQVAGVLAETPRLVPIVHPRGTTLTVKDLYFNVPARRGNLKSIATEFGHIETIVQDVALARSDVTLMLFHDHKKRLSLSATSQLTSQPSLATSAPSLPPTAQDATALLPLSRLEQALGISLAEHAIKLRVDLSALTQTDADEGFGDHASVSGWLWPIADELPLKTTSTRPKLLYINGRLVKDAVIHNQIRQLAQGAALTGIGYALYFVLPTKWLNINVHPSKQRIKIGPLNNIMAHLNHAIQSQLKNINLPQKPETHRKPQTKNSTQTHVSVPASYANPSQRPNNRQVCTEQQPYDRSMPEPASDAEPALGHTAHDSAARIHSLPICLEVVSGAAGLRSDMDTIKEGADTALTALSGLLFFSCGQYFFIKSSDWQLRLAQLFDSQWSDQLMSDKSKPLDGAKEVNQQLSALSQQMSAPDFMAFSQDIDAILTQHAIKTISSKQLLRWMLQDAVTEATSQIQ